MKKVKLKTTARGMQVDAEVWAQINRLRKIYGSINAALRVKLGLDPRQKGQHQ